MIEVITTLVILSIGFVIGAYTFNIPNKWGKWEDVMIVYEDYAYSLLQVRVSNKGEKQFKKLKIVKFANLDSTQKDQLVKILQKLKSND